MAGGQERGEKSMSIRKIGQGGFEPGRRMAEIHRNAGITFWAAARLSGQVRLFGQSPAQQTTKTPQTPTRCVVVRDLPRFHGQFENGAAATRTQNQQIMRRLQDRRFCGKTRILGTAQRAGQTCRKAGGPIRTGRRRTVIPEQPDRLALLSSRSQDKLMVSLQCDEPSGNLSYNGFEPCRKSFC